MFENNNKAIIQSLSNKKLKINPYRYYLIIGAIIMTTLLFTSTFTVATSLYKSLQYTTMRQAGTKAYGGFKSITPGEYNQLKDHKALKKVGRSQIIGDAVNEALAARAHQVFSMNEASRELSFISPLLLGHAPESYDEIILDTLTLDMLNLPHEVGQSITLVLDIQDEEQSFEFKLSGISQGDHMAMVSLVIVSDAFAEEILRGIDVEGERDIGDYTGLIVMPVNLNNHYNTYDKLVKIAEESEVDVNDNQIAVNWAYEAGTSNIQVKDYLTYITLIIILMFSGYLVIYNIFYIGIMNDMHFYGMLKTVGATRKQIKYLVMFQGFRLSVIGIPIGLWLGYGVGLLVFPYTVKALNITEVAFSRNPLIFIISALLTLLTIYISCYNPAKMAGNVTPIEAVRSNGGVVSKVKKHTRKSSKIQSPVIKMSVANVFRHKKKNIIVVLSLSLSLVLLMVVYNLVNSMDTEQFLERMIPSDFIVADVDLFSFRFNSEEGVEKTIIDEIKAQPGTSVNNIYCIYTSGRPSDIYTEFLNKDQNTPSYLQEKAGKYKIPYDVYAVDEGLYDALASTIVAGEFDMDKFITGNYILLDDHINVAYGEKDHRTQLGFYQVGDTVSIENEKGEEIDYEVMAIVDETPHYLYDGNFLTYGVSVYMSPESMASFSATSPVMASFIDVEEDARAAVLVILNHITRMTPRIAYKEKSDYVEELSSFGDVVKLIGYGLSALLGIIAFLNYINTFISGIIARRIELAMLESVGMGVKQFLGMLIIESMMVIGMSMILGVVVGGGISYYNSGQVAIADYGVDFFPLMIVLPCLLVITCIIPLIAYNILRRESLVDRLRVAE